MREIIGILRKRSMVILLIFLGALLTTAVVSALIKPTYEAEITLRIKAKKEVVSSMIGNLATGVEGVNKPSMSTYAEMIKSRAVLDGVIDKLVAQGKARPAYEQLSSSITIQPIKETELLRIKVQSALPQEAQQTANFLVESFNQRMGEFSRTEDKLVREFVGERLAESKRELEAAEDKLQKYKLEQKIVMPAEESKALIERVSAISQLSANNSVELAAFRAKEASNAQKLREEKVEAIANNQLTRQYQSKLADLEVERVGLLEKYTEEYPQVIANRVMIKEAREKLAEEVHKVINRESASDNQLYIKIQEKKMFDDAELVAKIAQRQAIDKVILQNEEALATLPSKERGFAKIMREVMVAQEVCLMLSKRYEEARISEVMQPNDVQVIDWAALPTKPIKPQKGVNMMAAAILGLLAGCAAAILLEYLNKSIRNAADVKRYLDLLVLGSIPAEIKQASIAARFKQHKVWQLLQRDKTFQQNGEAENALELVVATRPLCQMTEAYRALGNSLHFLKVEQAFKTILITGIEASERKSAVVANLALTLAQAGKRVIVLDFDLRKPTQHKIFDVESKGITDIFIEGAQMSEVIKNTCNKNLKLLPAGMPIANTSELLWNIQDFIASFKKEFDYVLLDAPAIMGVADTCMLVSKVDGVILEIDAEGKSRTELLQRGKEMILKSGGRIIGVILDRVENSVERFFYKQYHQEQFDMTDDMDIRR